MLESQSLIKSMCLDFSHFGGRELKETKEKKERGTEQRKKMKSFLCEITVNSAGQELDNVKNLLATSQTCLPGETHQWLNENLKAKSLSDLLHSAWATKAGKTRENTTRKPK